MFTEQTAFEAAWSEITASDGAYVINLGIREVEIVGYTWLQRRVSSHLVVNNKIR